MRPLVLTILDGWGLNPLTDGNAIFSTPTPNFDKLLSQFAYASLHASGEEVGLSWGEMGNSEVGHLNLGTGRVVMQDLPRIDKSIQDKSFFANRELLAALEAAGKNNGNVHLVGLFSSGGVHSHLNHLLAFLDLAKAQNFERVFIHLISDGRDTAPETILQDLPKLEAKINELGLGKIASVMGRYFAMDRDKRWERTDKAYKCLTDPAHPAAATAQDIIKHAYANNKSDEFIEPVAVTQTERVKPQDTVIFFNFRSDRAKQLSSKLIERNDLYFVSFTSYGFESSSLVKIAFFAEKASSSLPQILSQANLLQLHLAETEKYPHVTYFFGGGAEKPYPNEERILVPSPKVATYDLQPEMSARELTEKFIEFFNAKKPPFTVLNLANPDMVGHTGNFAATQKAVAAVDECLGKIAQTVLNTAADFIVTADHGNAEQMINPQTKEIDKEHTTNPVPLILGFLDKPRESAAIGLETKIALAAQPPVGVLSDVTATILERLGLEKSPEMTGQSLINII